MFLLRSTGGTGTWCYKVYKGTVELKRKDITGQQQLLEFTRVCCQCVQLQLCKLSAGRFASLQARSSHCEKNTVQVSGYTPYLTITMPLQSAHTSKTIHLQLCSLAYLGKGEKQFSFLLLFLIGLVFFVAGTPLVQLLPSSGTQSTFEGSFCYESKYQCRKSLVAIKILLSENVACYFGHCPGMVFAMSNI